MEAVQACVCKYKPELQSQEGWVSCFKEMMWKEAHWGAKSYSEKQVIKVINHSAASWWEDVTSGGRLTVAFLLILRLRVYLVTAGSQRWAHTAEAGERKRENSGASHTDWVILLRSSVSSESLEGLEPCRSLPVLWKALRHLQFASQQNLKIGVY